MSFSLFQKRSRQPSEIFLGVALLLMVAFAGILHADPPKFLQTTNIIEQVENLHQGFGIRPILEDKGVTFFGELVNDMLWNTTGGISPGGADDGVLQFGTQIDTEKAIGLPGGTFKNTWFWLYGRNPSGFVGDVFGVSGISANPAFRCYELWYEQNLGISGVDDALSLRAGLLGLDVEFCISDPASLFLNGTCGFPALMSQNLVNSGPQYPMATPGIRLALHPLPWLRLRSALSQANPFSQSENLHNFNWNFGPSGGLLSISEAEVRWGSEHTSRVLPGNVTTGFWIQNGPRGALPDEWSFGPPSSVSYFTGFYGVWNQMLYRSVDKEVPPTGKKAADPAPGDGDKPEKDHGLKSFMRLGFSPQPESPLSFYVDSGLVYTGLVSFRPEDKLGLAFIYGSVSPAYRSLGNQLGVPGASFESVVELTYCIRLGPGLALQPDLQYVLHPGGTRQYGNALVAGFRAIVDF